MVAMLANQRAPQLARYFHLDDEDRLLIAQRRGKHNRLGFVLQIGTLRFLGTFLIDPVNVPIGVIAYVASQLGIADPQCITQYAERVQTQQDHAQEIRQHAGYKEFSERRGRFALMRFLYARVWVGTERPSVLFDEGFGLVDCPKKFCCPASPRSPD